MLKLQDKNSAILEYRENNQGAVVVKGNRQLHLMFKSVNASEKARLAISQNSFDKMFKAGKKIRALGNNVAYLTFN